MPARSPSGPSATASTSAGSGNEEKITSASLASARGLSAQTAPALRWWLAACRRRSWTMSLKPAFCRLAAIGPPMVPSPTNPTVALDISPHSGFDFRPARYRLAPRPTSRKAGRQKAEASAARNGQMRPADPAINLGRTSMVSALRALACTFAVFAAIAGGARAEVGEITVAQQYGVSFLPLMVME